ncbi:rhamnulokinase family protein [Radiobacillus sp. PE A8.2]|uniref:rhamnulokinase n=1 Tax=Radiobacillus sp. PE A8.2 TaxID=3380349 RepID=UPI003890DBE7
MKKVWAFDLGASNGRLILSSFDGKRLHFEEQHRFFNSPVHVTNHYYWDILKIFEEMKVGMKKSLKNGNKNVESMGIDTWGVDFGLLSKNGELLSNPYSYRDPQHAVGMTEALKTTAKDDLFYRTGNETAPINTLFQLYGIQKNNPSLLENAETLLMTPNLISYLFSGEKRNEFTISSTTQMLDKDSKDWDTALVKQFGIPAHIFAPVTMPMTSIGHTLPEINLELLMDPVKVINIAGHDTASALAALPIKDNNSVFMSCGTWVLMGVQVEKPVVTQEAYEWGFTNEGTIDGQYRLLKNNMGLWLLQQCRIIWEKEGIATNYIEEDQLGANATSFQSFINPDDPSFFNPTNMVEAIQAFCRNSGQKVPETRAEILTCILESLALKYRWVVERLEKLTGKQLNKIHMGGGGIQNQRLCHFTANATDREVIAGPIEASSIGNSIAQWISLGELNNLSEAREIVDNSFDVAVYEPKNQMKWQEAYDRFKEFV